MMLAKEEGKQLVYLIHEEIPQIIRTFYEVVGKEKLCIEIPETVIWLLFSLACFDKLPEILEYGEEWGMDITAAHCPLDKIALGAVGGGVIPKPDFITSGGFFCDQGPKQAEAMGELLDVPYYIITDAARDEPWGLFPEIDEENAIYFGESMERHFKQFARELGVELTQENFHKARIDVAKGWAPMQEVSRLIAGADQRPISVNDEEPLVQLTMYPDWRTDELNEAWRMLISEIKDRIAKGEGVVPKGALRTNFFCDPRPDVVEMCEKELGINLVVPGIFYWMAPFEKTRKFPKDANQFVRFTEAYIRRAALRCSAWDTVYRAREYVKHFRLDGYMAAYEYGCRPLCWYGRWIKDDLEKELNVPVIYFEQSADPRVYSPEQLRTKIETFSSLMRIRKAKAARAKAA
ncbi:MAG: 2-hydroxyacyl-CoA dehydratase family protein [Pseudomonadota bacterium]